MRFLGFVIGAFVFGILGLIGGTGGLVLCGLLGALLMSRLLPYWTGQDALEKRVAALEAAMAALPVERAPAADTAPRAATPADAGEPPREALTPAEAFARTALGDTQPWQPTSAPAAPDIPAAPGDPPWPVADVAPIRDADDLAGRAFAWLTGGNVVARAGALILFIGLAFLMKLAYAAVAPGARLAGVAAGGAALLALGWRLRATRPGYAVSLQGAGVAILYLTVYGALRLFGMVDAASAFVLMALVAGAAAVLAVRQESQALAVLGFGGGFLAPILASTGQGSHVVLFGYYALVNAGLAAVAWNRAWRPLTFAGFILTFGVAALWGWKYFQPALFATTQPFLLLFLASYLALQVRFALLRAPRWNDVVDGTSVFGVPLVGFGLQAALVRDFEYGTALSAAALGAVYAVLSSRLRRHPVGLGMLTDAYAALAAGFLTLAIPLAVDARWTAAAWALEGAGIAWAALRSGRRLPLALGLGLQAAAAAAFVLGELRPEPGLAVLNRAFLGAVMLAAAALFTAWRADVQAREARAATRTPVVSDGLALLLFAWGLAWWFGAGLREIERHVPGNGMVPSALLFAAFTAAAFQAACERLPWPRAQAPALASVPATVLLAVLETWSEPESRPPLEGVGLIAWPAAWAAHLGVLSRHPDASRGLRVALHALVPVTMALVLGREIDLRLWNALGDTSWSLIGQALPAAVLLFLPVALLARRGGASADPTPAEEGWALHGAGLLAAGLAVWSLLAGVSGEGYTPPIPWWPLANPLDLAVLAMPLLALPWLRVARAHFAGHGVTGYAAHVPAALALVTFVNLNFVLLRDFAIVLAYGSWHELLLLSSEVQAGLSLLWTTVALAAMWAASRSARRPPWFAGAWLMAIAVAKLLLVDLANAGTLARIVSFVGVGGLMLVIGWVSPLPPRSTVASGLQPGMGDGSQA
jgi:uncharacterized membrane protein